MKILVGILTLMCAVAPVLGAEQKTSNAPFLKPAEAVAKMSIPKGFQVDVFAAEPDIGEPIAFCFDDRGRMWVVENMNYVNRRSHLDGPLSRIQILEDVDGDGVFDKKKLFTDKIAFSSGIALGFGGVFLGTPPNLVFIPDKDGDDVPDGEAEVLLDGWGIKDRHETLNSFIWGPDGWLYGCHGVFTQSEVGHVGDAKEDRDFIDGGIWRYHPTKKIFEVFAHGLSNPWGFDFNDHGQGFATCCVIPHLFHVSQGGVYHKQSRGHINPYVFDDIKTIRDHTHRSAHGGARFYLADAFPAEYRDRLFMCNIHQHEVLTDIIKRKGSGFVGSHGDDFLPTNDLAWVGFSVLLGPEGGIYILDWHDTDICGNAINFPDSGRIYRVMPENAKPIKQPNLRAMSDKGLVDLQMHANDWYVREARVLLQSRKAAGTLDAQVVHAGLHQMFGKAPNSGKRLRALWALHVTGAFAGEGAVSLERYLNHEDEYVRGWAIQLLCEDGAPRGEALVKFTQMATEDASPVVRLYLACALQRFEYKDRWPILGALAGHSEDVGDQNLSRMLWFALEPMVPGASERSLQLALGGKFPSLREFVARRMVSGNVVADAVYRPQTDANPAFQRLLLKAAPGFKIQNVGLGGVVAHESFRNEFAVQTHPLDKGKACTLYRNVQVPASGKTKLKMRVSHHPHGDWKLRVLAGRKLILDQVVGADTVGKDEWLNVEADLTQFAGQTVEVVIENRATDWRNEWGYWNSVRVVNE